MPEISRFFGIIIRMFAEAGSPHHVPHFHAWYQGAKVVYGIDPVVKIEGGFPRRQERLIEAWAELHQDELKRDWELLRAGENPIPVAPLQ